MLRMHNRHMLSHYSITEEPLACWYIQRIAEIIQLCFLLVVWMQIFRWRGRNWKCGPTSAHLGSFVSHRHQSPVWISPFFEFLEKGDLYYPCKCSKKEKFEEGFWWDLVRPSKDKICSGQIAQSYLYNGCWIFSATLKNSMVVRTWK